MTPKTSLPGPARNGTQFHLNNTAGLAQKSLDKAIREGKISPDDVNLIQTYIRERRHNKSLAISTQNKILFYLLAWRKETPAFRDQTIGDVYAALEKFTGSNGEPSALKKNTVHTLFGVVRPFLYWLINEGHNTHLSEKKIRAIKRPPAETMTKKAGDMLTKEDLENMIRACSSSRDRALLMMLYEGGFRISELGNLTWGDMKFDNNGVVVNTNAKTMKPRYIRLTMSRQYLATWKADYPFSPDPEAVVFITNRKEAITYDGVRRQILYIAERAGITRKITPHLFRHSRITHLIQQGVSESVIKLMMWGSVKTDMFETYAHLTGTDIDRAMFELNGIKEPGKAKPEKLEARQCPNCYEISGPLTNFCPKCGNQLTEEAKEITTSAQDAVINHPELKALLKALGMSDSAIDLLLKQVRKE